MYLLLARHGNTFAPGDPVVCASSSTDFPLVKRGKEQAFELAEALRSSNIIPANIFCGPLLRTRECAEIVQKELSSPVEITVDTRLNEIDYGGWSGLSREEIIEQYGPMELEAWDKYGKWPASGVWNTCEDSFEREVKLFCGDLYNKFTDDDLILIITSNGRLRYFLKLCQAEYERRAGLHGLKVGTGNVCLMRFDQVPAGMNTDDPVSNTSSPPEVFFWNEEPSDGICSMRIA